METVAINGKVRTEVGKRATKAIRNADEIPCVLYGGEDLIHFSITPSDVKDLIYTADFKIAEINIDGNTYKSIVKDVQFHPVSERILHIDFLHLVDGQPVKIEVPIRFKGTSPGVKSGGKLMPKLRRVKVKTTPENMVNELMVDISKLQLGHSIRVRDIKPGEGIEIVLSPGIPVASVEIPRVLRSAAPAAAAVEEEEGGEEEEATEE